MIRRAFFLPPQGPVLAPIVVVNIQNYYVYGNNEFVEITEGRGDEALKITARFF